MKPNYMRRTNKNIVMSKADINKLKKDVAKEATSKAVVCILAYIMEEQPIDCDADKIVEIFEGVERYVEAIDDHLINIDKVCKIIKEYTGLDIVWR